MLKKKCQICASLPITCFEVPIIGTTELNLTSEEIYKCLCAKAEITEILSNGQHVILDFGNYDKDNNPIEEPVEDDSDIEEIASIVEEVKEPEVIEEVVKTESVAEETIEVKVEETASIVEEVKEPEVIEEVVKTESVAEETVEKVSENVKNYQVASRNNIKKGNKK